MLDKSTRWRLYGEIKKLIEDVHVFTTAKEYEDFIRKLTVILEV